MRQTLDKLFWINSIWLWLREDLNVELESFSHALFYPHKDLNIEGFYIFYWGRKVMGGYPFGRKGSAVGIILLFVGISIIPAIAQDSEKSLPTSRGNWLYVGGDGPGNYSKIQDAIDNANDGDTVFVYSGTYHEYIVIDKSIQFVGEDRNTTIIDGDDRGGIVSISASQIGMSGFTVQHSVTSWNNTGIEINAYSDFNNISQNIIKETGEGISIYNSNHNLISNNIISSISDVGIILDDVSDNNSIRGNIISICNTGITLRYSSNNLIYDNIIGHSNAGIFLQNASYNNISWNHFTKNFMGVYLVFSKSNRFLYNNFLSINLTAFFENGNNKWNGNYWNRPRVLPEPIVGLIVIPLSENGIWISILWFNFDWHPAQESYDIGG
jgi:parallel beta-helix repeat protein